MKLKQVSLFFSIAAVVLLHYSTAANASTGGEWDIRKESIEQEAPDFILEDIKGNEVQLNDYRGKTVLIVFSTTWCPHCRAEIPYLKELYSKYEDRDFEILNINIQESRKKVASFASRHKIPYQVLLDYDGAVAQLYGVRGVPTKILVDENGVILCRSCRSENILLDNIFGDTDDVESNE